MKRLGLEYRKNGEKFHPGELSALGAALGAQAKTIRDKLLPRGSPGLCPLEGIRHLGLAMNTRQALGVENGAIMGRNEACRLSSPWT